MAIFRLTSSPPKKDSPIMVSPVNIPSEDSLQPHVNGVIQASFADPIGVQPKLSKSIQPVPVTIKLEDDDDLQKSEHLQNISN